MYVILRYQILINSRRSSPGGSSRFFFLPVPCPVLRCCQSHVVISHAQKPKNPKTQNPPTAARRPPPTHQVVYLRLTVISTSPLFSSHLGPSSHQKGKKGEEKIKKREKKQCRQVEEGSDARLYLSKTTTMTSDNFRQRNNTHATHNSPTISKNET